MTTRRYDRFSRRDPKNAKLKGERGIWFEGVDFHIERGDPASGRLKEV